MLLKNKLNSLRLDENGSINDYLVKVQSLLHQLASIGVVIPETDVMASIPFSLPSSWEGLSNNLIYRTDLP